MTKGNCFVTGGTGFLGGKLCTTLKELGYNVRTIGRNDSKGNLLKELDIDYIHCNLEDKNMIKLMEGYDYVIHCGAKSDLWGKYNEFYNSNVIGTNNILDGCLMHKVKRLIYISTPSIYFDWTDRINIKEDDYIPNKLCNDYAITKYIAEKNVLSSNLFKIVLRPRGIFGEGDNSIFPRLIESNRKGVPIINEGKALTDVTYVSNVVYAIIQSLNFGVDGGVYNITNGEPKHLIELLEELFDKLGIRIKKRKINYNVAMMMANIIEKLSYATNKKPIITPYSIGLLSKSLTLNIDKARDELKYSPKISISDGMNRFVKMYNKLELRL